MEELEQKALLVAISVIITLVLREWFARRREERDRSSWQINNIKPFYFDEYLTDEIKDHRKSLQNKKTDFINIDINLEKDKDKISKAVQRIGIMTYIGAIPLSYVLIMNGFQVVTDWMHIAKFVDKVRGNNWLREGNSNIPYARRHAEWLSLVCFMYLKNSRYSVNSDTLNGISEFEKYYGSYEKILSAEKNLRQGDIQFAGSANMREVNSIRRKYWLNEILKSNNPLHKGKITR
uniref:Uncharacterized protein n=1 Tax=Candidatus Kentrum sp. LFY TaxID=2126342 RepID=A0A450X184_9GAMM|nr:MAG: hypothetical protein BECKLFY1418C_GA0070996_113311 [Candidatus Kentron sp. LFY]